MSPEEEVRKAALSCLNYWCGDKRKEEGLEAKTVHILPPEIHNDCLVTSLLQGKQRAISTKGTSFRMTAAAAEEDNAPSSLFRDEGNAEGCPMRTAIVSAKILAVGSEDAASVQVKIETKATPIQGFLTLLKSQQTGWKCISAAFSNTSNNTILPSHFQAVNQLTWDGYCAANQACDGVAMAKVFHPTCRLTFVGDKPDDDSQDDIVIFSQPEFCNKVQHRYTEAMHQPYAKLENHPNLGLHNSLQAVEFATPDVCMVTLKVGHPPCLWTDLLICCYLGPESENGGDSATSNSAPTSGWWIMHKSSCHVDFELEDDMKAILAASNNE